MKNILKYLRRIKDIFLVYKRSELKLESFTDFNFQSNPNDCKSISRYVFILNGGAVNWKSTKQQIVADSVTETKYIAISEGAKEAI